MFTNKTIELLEPRIKTSIKQLFEFATKNQKNPNDIVLYLANAHFDKELQVGNLTGHLIGEGIRGWDDVYRREFIYDYLNSGNKLSLEGIEQNEADRLVKFSINLELMIYAHIWEIDMLLNDLRQLANLVSNKVYEWESHVPETGKREFINEFRDIFIEHNLDIGNILKETYHSQIRNAFAHGQYSLRIKDVITLLNYKNKDYEVRGLPYNEWEVRFIKTCLLFHELLNQKRTLLEYYGKNYPTLSIWMPTEKQNEFKRIVLHWHEYSKRYIFKP